MEKLAERNYNHERLKSARRYRGLTREELAQELKIETKQLSLYENNVEIPELELMLTASRYLRFPIQYFYEEDKVDIIQGYTFFRM